ncbi:hypothetical protein YC2023_037102 [Brassica napus]
MSVPLISVPVSLSVSILTSLWKLYRISGNGQLSPLKAQIYKLEDLSTRLKDIGYELDTSYVLQDIDDEHKEAILAHHSERVAIDFGLIDTE